MYTLTQKTESGRCAWSKPSLRHREKHPFDKKNKKTKEFVGKAFG
jgi:hypothetical protein